MPLVLKPFPSNGIKVAIIGAGPIRPVLRPFPGPGRDSRCRYSNGKAFAGGWASDAIPAFRLDEASIRKDIDAILSLGVTIHYGARVDREQFETLRKQFDYVYVAVGAQEGMPMGVPGEDAAGVMDQLRFLSAVRRGERPNLGKKGGRDRRRQFGHGRGSHRQTPGRHGRGGHASFIGAPEKRCLLRQRKFRPCWTKGIKLVELAAPERVYREEWAREIDCMLQNGAREKRMPAAAHGRSKSKDSDIRTEG